MNQSMVVILWFLSSDHRDQQQKGFATNKEKDNNVIIFIPQTIMYPCVPP